MINVGDTVIVGTLIREVTGFTVNNCGDKVVLWKSKRETGACVPSLWFDWVEGKQTFEDDLK